MLLLPNLATSDFCCSENPKKKYIIENTGRFLARIFSVHHGTSHTSCSSMSRVICNQKTQLPNIHHTVYYPSRERIITYPTYGSGKSSSKVPNSRGCVRSLESKFHCNFHSDRTAPRAVAFIPLKRRPRTIQ